MSFFTKPIGRQVNENKGIFYKSKQGGGITNTRTYEKSTFR